MINSWCFFFLSSYYIDMVAGTTEMEGVCGKTKSVLFNSATQCWTEKCWC